MADYNNIIGGLNIPTQIPLDVKTISLTESALASLGTGNNKAFTYYDGLKVYCLDTRKMYEWREVGVGEANTGLVTLDFTYPNNIVSFGITYSNKIFNFFEISGTGPAGVDGEDGKGIVSIIKTNTTGLVDTYTITYTDATTSTFTVTNGAQGAPGTNGTNGVDATANNLQKVINANYTITNADDNYTIFVNNSSTNITVTIPDGLTDSLSIGFIQEGTGDVTFVTSGVSTLNTVVGFKIAGQNDNVLLEKKLATSTYYLLGNTKL